VALVVSRLSALEVEKRGALLAMQAAHFATESEIGKRYCCGAKGDYGRMTLFIERLRDSKRTLPNSGRLKTLRRQHIGTPM
jgi:hypothetical protein